MPRVVVAFGSTSLGGFVAPAGVTSVQLLAWGGGGGGGAGYYGWPYKDATYVGGAGGGGALKDVAEIAVVPGTAYDVVIGAGGVGSGANGSMQWRGANGGDTLLRVSAGAQVLATFRGAEGGTSAWGLGADPTALRIWGVLGGGPVPGDGFGWMFVTNSLLPAREGPGIGGYGVVGDEWTAYGRNGAPSVQGFLGGVGGAPGASDGGYRGGGPGGGGAAGPAGAGGNGGEGGFGKQFGAPGPGAAGSSAPLNSGAGGGGGGTAGASGGFGAFGPGGDGGSGHLTLAYVL